jgi:cobyrinic acid a,c-diamide synthase
MGLFDGTPSSADLARHFGVPVLAVIDGTAMAQTFGALALGLARYQPDLPFAGVLANRVGTLRHAQLLEGSLTEGLRWYGGCPASAASSCPAATWGWCRPAS